MIGLVIVLGMISGNGCKKTEATYQGKPLTEWITLTTDHDFRTQVSGYKAVAEFGSDEKDERIAPLLEKGLRLHIGPITYPCAAALYKRRQPIIPDVTATLQDEVRDSGYMISSDELDKLIMSMGRDSAQLLPVLTAARDRATSDYSREQAERAIKAVTIFK
jgi:hypothetical protein